MFDRWRTSRRTLPRSRHRPAWQRRHPTCSRVDSCHAPASIGYGRTESLFALWATRAQPAQPLLACQADKHPARMRERYRDRLEACDRVWDCLREDRRKGQRVMECASPRRICARLDLPRSRRRRAQSTRAGAPAATLGRLPCCVCVAHTAWRCRCAERFLCAGPSRCEETPFTLHAKSSPNTHQTVH